MPLTFQAFSSQHALRLYVIAGLDVKSRTPLLGIVDVEPAESHSGDAAASASQIPHSQGLKGKFQVLIWMDTNQYTLCGVLRKVACRLRNPKEVFSKIFIRCS